MLLFSKLCTFLKKDFWENATNLKIGGVATWSQVKSNETDISNKWNKYYRFLKYISELVKKNTFFKSNMSDFLNPFENGFLLFSIFLLSDVSFHIKKILFIFFFLSAAFFLPIYIANIFSILTISQWLSLSVFYSNQTEKTVLNGQWSALIQCF